MAVGNRSQVGRPQTPLDSDGNPLRRGQVDEFVTSPCTSALRADVAASPTERGDRRDRRSFAGDVGLHIGAKRGLGKAQDGRTGRDADVSHFDPLAGPTKTRITVTDRGPKAVSMRQHYQVENLAGFGIPTDRSLSRGPPAEVRTAPANPTARYGSGSSGLSAAAGVLGRSARRGMSSAMRASIRRQ